MEEKRRIKRRHLVFYLRVFDNISNELLGYLVDITPEGAMLISEQPLETDKEYELRMDLPTEIGRKSHLVFKARSLWNKPDINPSFYDTGFQIIDLADEDVGLINSLISFFGFQD